MLPLGKFIGSLITHEINMNICINRLNRRIKMILHSKSSNIDDEEQESEDKDFDLIIEKFIKHFKFENIKRKRLLLKEKTLSTRKKKIIVTILNTSDKDFM